MDKPYTDEQWCKMVDAGLSEPVPLSAETLTDEWVYYRPWGVMYVPSGYHQRAMATLFAFASGYPNVCACSTALNIPGYRAMETLADRFISKLDGTAFKSSVGTHITTSEAHKLNGQERAAFRKYDIIYIGE